MYFGPICIRNPKATGKMPIGSSPKLSKSAENTRSQTKKVVPELRDNLNKLSATQVQRWIHQKDWLHLFGHYFRR